MTAILAARLGGLGDLLVALPSLRLVRAAFPGRRLVLRARAEYASLLRERGVVDDVLSPDAAAEPGGGGERFGWFQSPSSVPGVPGKYFVFDPDAGLSVSRFFFERTGEALSLPESRRPGFEACASLPGGPPPRRDGPAVVHPGSGSARKRWPLEGFLALAGELSRRGCPGRMVVGEAEAAAEIAGRLAATRLPSGWELWTSPPLARLAEALERAPLYVGNDSGVTHLAAACGAPSLALFRSEFVSAWAPYGRTIVLSADDVGEIARDAVSAAAVLTLESG